jgi:hypothetical protein
MQIAQLFNRIVSFILLVIFCPLPFLWWIFISIPSGIIRGIKYQRRELNDVYKFYLKGHLDD